MPQKFFTQALIKIDGRPVPTEFMDTLIEVVVDNSLHLPGMFTILLRDYDLKWVNDTTLLDLGKTVKIEVETGEELGGHKGLLIEGEIAALEPEFSIHGDTTLLIRGYDKSHRLHRGKKTRTFLKQKDSDIVRKIAGEVGLSPQMDNTTIRYDYVMQTNQTNMEFLQARATRLGYQVYADSQKLYFKKGDAVLGNGPTLKFKESLDTFRPSLAATHQPDKMVVKGWDSKQKKAIIGQASPNGKLNQGGMTKTGGAAAGVFGGAEAVVVDQPVFTVDEANALATGLSNDISREFIRAEGTCLGNPNIKAGWTVTIENVGKRFSGKYFVTAVTHIYNETGFNTHFSITGRQPDTVSHLLESSNGHHRDSGRIQGVAIGLVTNLNDPDKLGRVKVKYPWLGDDVESDWVRIATPNAGANRGFFYLPEVNDEVLLAFQHGNPHHPYIIGYLWNSKDKPPQPQGQPVASGKVNQRIIQSRSGHYFILDDTQGREKITVQSKGTHKIILDDGGKKISIIDETGSNKMEIDSTQNSITINATKDLTLKCGNKLTLDCTELAVTAKARGSIKANASLDLEGTAQTNVKGTNVNVNGNAMVQVQGALVKIN